jgi:hypothetical protein
MNFRIALAVLALGTSTAFALDVNSSTEGWFAVPYVNGRSDYINDQQTGDNESDLVGSAPGVLPVQTAFYFTFDGAQIGFKVRVDGDGQDSGQYKGAIWVGIMLDSNNTVDLFAGAIIGEKSGAIGFYSPGAGANTGPSTTTIQTATPLYSVATNANNYLWTPVTVGPTGNDPVPGGTNDVGNDGEGDYFATWILPFSSFQSAAEARGFTVNANTTMRFVVGTAQQENSINQDLNGTSGNTKSSLTFVELGAVSPEVTPSGGIIVPIPEPATWSCLALVGVAALWRRRVRA